MKYVAEVQAYLSDLPSLQCGSPSTPKLMGRMLNPAIKEPCKWNHKQSGKGGKKKRFRLRSINLKPDRAAEFEQRKMEQIQRVGDRANKNQNFHPPLLGRKYIRSRA